VFERGIILG